MVSTFARADQLAREHEPVANIFEIAPATIRPPLLLALETAWPQLAEPGAWLTGAQRLAVVAEARHAWSCGLCRERKTALSPYTVRGEHDDLGDLPREWVDVIHRVATDSGRLTQSWFSEALDAGIEEDEFVEIIGVAILAITIDAFADGIGVKLTPLPDAQPGTPPRERWERATPGPGWVSTTAPNNAGPELEDHYVNGRGQFNIVRSLTLVPAAATQLFALLDCLYMPNPSIRELEGIDRSISRAQIEYLAARSSSLFGCFY